ncbi:RNA pyrophosphohydrolase [Streptomyces sp. MBT84]|nr:RNA pyrophosphohydrolase [Streptomyces sp. MBT84]
MGLIEDEESPEQAAAREVLEETGWRPGAQAVDLSEPANESQTRSITSSADGRRTSATDGEERVDRSSDPAADVRGMIDRREIVSSGRSSGCCIAHGRGDPEVPFASHGEQFPQRASNTAAAVLFCAAPTGRRTPEVPVTRWDATAEPFHACVAVRQAWSTFLAEAGCGPARTRERVASLVWCCLPAEVRRDQRLGCGCLAEASVCDACVHDQFGLVEVGTQADRVARLDAARTGGAPR